MQNTNETKNPFNKIRVSLAASKKADKEASKAKLRLEAYRKTLLSQKTEDRDLGKLADLTSEFFNKLDAMTNAEREYYRICDSL